MYKKNVISKRVLVVQKRIEKTQLIMISTVFPIRRSRV